MANKYRPFYTLDLGPLTASVSPVPRLYPGKTEEKPEPVLTEADVDRLEEMIKRWDDPKHWSNLVQRPLSKPHKRITWLNGMPYITE